MLDIVRPTVFRLFYVALVALSTVGYVTASAQGSSPVAYTLPASAHTPNGVEVSTAALTLRVDALRPDVLRVRVFPAGHPAEDASWAVLGAARTARVSVTAEAAGFSTSALRVTVLPDLRVTVADLKGNVLQKDAKPVEWSAD